METHGTSVQVYGKKAVSRKCVYDWFKRFRDGKETTEDEPRWCRPLADPNVAHPHFKICFIILFQGGIITISN
jgi:hypothetical protein